MAGSLAFGPQCSLSSMTKASARWSAAALAGRERFSRARFIAEQTRIYKKLFPIAGTADVAAAVC